MRKRLIPVLLALALSASLPGRSVLAAAEMVSSNPAAGATLSADPGEIRAVFSEPITAESTLTLVDQQGVVISDESRVAPEDANNRTLVLSTGGLQPGRYTVSWFTVSANDLSLAEGTFSFTLTGAAATATPSERPTQAPTQVPSERPTQVPSERPTQVPSERPTEAVATPTRRTSSGGLSTEAQGGGSSAAPTRQAAPAASAMPMTSSLPNTAAGAPGAWSFGLLAGLAALGIWIVRRRTR
jgi:methionine-rich copper-binding protein CopC